MIMNELGFSWKIVQFVIIWNTIGQIGVFEELVNRVIDSECVKGACANSWKWQSVWERQIISNDISKLMFEGGMAQ